MNVKFLPILLLLLCKTFALTLNLSNIPHAKPIQSTHHVQPPNRFAKLQMVNHQYAHPNHSDDKLHKRRLDETSELDDKEYPVAFEEEEDSDDEPEVRPPPVIASVEDRSKLNFETQEIQDAINFIEFKMNEINVLIQECINEEFEKDIMADVFIVKHQCVGTTFQILYFNYREGVRKLKEILLELLKIKLQQLDDVYEDEANFFIDMLDQLIDMDYDLPQSILVAKRASRFYVSPRFFDSLITIARPELKAFHKIHKRLRQARNEIQANLEAHEHKQEEYIDNLEHKAEVYEQEKPDEADIEEEPEEEEVEDEPEEEPAEMSEEMLEKEQDEEGQDTQEEQDQEEAETETTGEEPVESETAGGEEGKAAETGGEAEGSAEKEGASESTSETAAEKTEGGEAKEGGEAPAPTPAEAPAESRRRKLINSKYSIHQNFYKKPTYTFKPWKANSNLKGRVAANSKVHALQMAKNQIKFKTPNLRNRKHI